jgi:DNA-binding protein HU-beta
MNRNSTTHKEFIKLYAKKLDCTEAEAALHVATFVETLLEEMKARNKVTISQLGGFYIEDKRESTSFKFNPSQHLKAILGWSNTYKGVL